MYLLLLFPTIAYVSVVAHISLYVFYAGELNLFYMSCYICARAHMYIFTYLPSSKKERMLNPALRVHHMITYPLFLMITNLCLCVCVCYVNMYFELIYVLQPKRKIF